jgi:hypothetical protein
MIIVPRLAKTVFAAGESRPSAVVRETEQGGFLISDRAYGIIIVRNHQNIKLSNK